MKYKRLVTVLAMLIAVSAFGQSIDRVVFRQQGAYPFSEDIFEMNTQTKAGMPMLSSWMRPHPAFGK